MPPLLYSIPSKNTILIWLVKVTTHSQSVLPLPMTLRVKATLGRVTGTSLTCLILTREGLLLIILTSTCQTPMLSIAWMPSPNSLKGTPALMILHMSNKSNQHSATRRTSIHLLWDSSSIILVTFINRYITLQKLIQLILRVTEVAIWNISIRSMGFRTCMLFGIPLFTNGLNLYPCHWRLQTGIGTFQRARNLVMSTQSTLQQFFQESIANGPKKTLKLQKLKSTPNLQIPLPKSTRPKANPCSRKGLC